MSEWANFSKNISKTLRFKSGRLASDFNGWIEKTTNWAPSQWWFLALNSSYRRIEQTQCFSKQLAELRAIKCTFYKDAVNRNHLTAKQHGNVLQEML